MQSAPQSLSEVIVVPLLCLFFGLGIWLAAWNRERMYGEKPKWRWVALAPLLLGAYVGWRYFYPLVNPADSVIYQEAIPFVGRRRVVYGCYFAFLGPTLCALGLALWSFFQSRRRTSDY